MWQRARLIAQDTVTADQPPPGFLFWVKVEPPRRFELGPPDPRFPSMDDEPRYRSNLVHEGCGLAVSPDMVELLAEFCDQPPLILWGSWNDGTPAQR